MARKDIAGTGGVVSNSTWDDDLQVRTTKCVLLGLFGSCKAGSDQYVMVFDSASAVSDGTAPDIHPIYIKGGDNFFIELPVRGMEFDSGVYVAFSSTNSTLTKSTSDCWFTGVTV
jgi:hypothetical protein